MAPSGTSGGGPSQSSSASGVFFQGGGPNSQLNSASSISGAPASSTRPASGGQVNRAAQSAASSGPSVGASSLVTDANSALSGGPHLRRSASINTESYLRLPASPMSFSSNNNISISGSSVVDGSSVAQPPPQGSQQDQCPRQMQQLQGVASTATSQLNSQMGQILGNQSNTLGIQKKPRLDLRQEEIFQQLLQRHDSFQPQGHTPQMQALIQHQRLLQQRQQQQQILQSMSQMQPVHIQHQQQMLQSMPPLKQYMQQQQHAEQPAAAMKHQYYSGICARRLMQYLYHLRQRPSDNSILYWRKFVVEYFAPCAKKRWCLSLYHNFGHYGHFIFPQSTTDVWQCDICGSKPGRGFEITFEVLPRLNKIKFDSGVIDELLFVDMPYERRLPSGLMVLECQKATQESIYEQLRVVREGQLRIIFTPDLKILSWEFCARRHEELLPRRLVTPQVNQLLQVVQKYESAVSESGSAGVPVQDLQTNCNMFLTAGRQLARNLDLQSLNELGFSKRYVRCLQISEVVSSMKDLIEFSREHKMGPIESLKNYPRVAAAAVKLQTPKLQEMGRMVNFQGLSSEQSSLNKLMAMNPGLSDHLSSNVSIAAPNSSAQTAIAMGGYQNLLRQNSVNSNHSSCQWDASCSTSGSNQNQSIPFQGSVSSIPISMQVASIDDMLRPHQQNLLQQNQQPSHPNQHPQQLAIQQVLQEISSNGAMSQPLVGQNAKGNINEDVRVRTDSGVVGFGGSSIDMPNNAAGIIPARTNSFKASSNNSSGVSSSAFKSRPDGSQNHQLRELVQDVHHDFAENGVFNSEVGDLGYEWKF